MSTALSQSTRLRQNARVAARVYDGLAEVITLDQPIRQHRLNRVGTRIWELAETGATIGDLAQTLTDEFEVDLEHACTDALRFCGILVERGILVAEARAAT